MQRINAESNDTLESHPAIYNDIGSGYAKFRRPDPRIAKRINTALGSAISICNVGAGAGSYEPADRETIAVEPSQKMIAQRSSKDRVVRATAEALPFRDKVFDAALAVLTLHHWQDARRGIQELVRVSHRQVILTFDPAKANDFWLVRDYLPEARALDEKRCLAMEDYAKLLPGSRVEPVPVPWDCVDGFQACYWRRPHAYLDAERRKAISTFAQLPVKFVDRAIRQLSSDLDDGSWYRKQRNLLHRPSLDVGYRLITAGPS